MQRGTDFSRFWTINPDFPEQDPKHARRLRISGLFHAQKADPYDVAQRTGLHVLTVLKYVNLWSIKPQTTTAEAIAQALGIETVDYIDGKPLRENPKFGRAIAQAKQVARRRIAGESVKVTLNVMPRRVRRQRRGRSRR